MIYHKYIFLTIYLILLMFNTEICRHQLFRYPNCKKSLFFIIHWKGGENEQHTRVLKHWQKVWKWKSKNKREYNLKKSIFCWCRWKFNLKCKTNNIIHFFIFLFARKCLDVILYNKFRFRNGSKLLDGTLLQFRWHY